MLIEVYYDLVCPWCYIGMHTLREALARRPVRRPILRWQPYLLHPELPREGADRDAYLEARLGGRPRAQQNARAAEAAAAEVGLGLALDRITRLPSTVDAHRLIDWADRHGLATALVFRLMEDYFQHRRDISEAAVLLEAVAELGLDRTAAATVLAGTEGQGHLRAAEAAAAQLRLRAVPAFVFNRRYALSGAQDTVSFFPLLDLAESRAMTDPIRIEAFGF